MAGGRGGRLALAAGLGLGAGAPGATAAELRWAFQGDAETMDPYGRFEIFTLGFLGNVYEPLVRYDADLTLEPALATAWEQVDDTTLAVRPAPRRHLPRRLGLHGLGCGVLVRAGDEGRLGAGPHPRPGARGGGARRPQRSSSGWNGRSRSCSTRWPFWYVMDEDWARSVGAEDPVNLREGISNAAALEANGTGPFQLVEREPGARTVLEVHDGWWDEARHNLDRVVFTPVEADSTRVAALLSGQVDMIDPLPLQDAERVAATAGVRSSSGRSCG